VTVANLDRSLQQRMDALRHANQVRSRRSRMKSDIKARRVDPAGIVRNPPEHAHTMKVFDLLLCVPKVGRVKATKWLQQQRISPSKTLGGLSGRQRKDLAAQIADPVARPNAHHRRRPPAPVRTCERCGERMYHKAGTENGLCRWCVAETDHLAVAA
jgi:hypothetical protein